MPKIRKGLHVELNNYQIEREIIEKIPVRLVRRYNFIPIFSLENVLTIATPDPDDLDTIDKISQATKFNIDALYADQEMIQKSIDKYYGVISEVDSLLMSIDESKMVETRASQIDTMTMFDIAEENIDDAPAVRIVNLVIRDAIVRGASDIHIEPADKDVLLRLRVDGKLLEVNKLPKSMLATIISRIKVIGEMDIAETRTPQDGRIRAKYQNGRYDLRISVLPTVYGENVVIRISGGESLTAKLDAVGFEDDDLDLMRAALSASQGMFLVTGPTGSGKTTTLYACLDYLNKITHNIITLEDPVEKEMPLIRQVNINDKVGLTFGTGLRSVLRQDPDIVMVGEIRDQETAQLAIRASLTGHYVLSTVHTNDCPSTITRIVDIGVKPFLVSSAINGILAQRLVRRVCPHCTQSFKPDPKVLQLLDLPYDHDYKKGSGCDHCRNSGYLGRIPIFELMILNREIRDAIAEDATADELRHLAIRSGMKTIVKDGRAKILHGFTTPEEVLSVTTLLSENA